MSNNINSLNKGNSMKSIGSPKQENETFFKREDYQKELLRKLEGIKDKVKEGGGKKSIEKKRNQSTEFINRNTLSRLK